MAVLVKNIDLYARLGDDTIFSWTLTDASDDSDIGATAALFEVFDDDEAIISETGGVLSVAAGSVVLDAPPSWLDDLVAGTYAYRLQITVDGHAQTITAGDFVVLAPSSVIEAPSYFDSVEVSTGAQTINASITLAGSGVAEKSSASLLLNINAGSTSEVSFVSGFGAEHGTVTLTETAGGSVWTASISGWDSSKQLQVRTLFIDEISTTGEDFYRIYLAVASDGTLTLSLSDKNASIASMNGGFDLPIVAPVYAA